MTLNSSFEIGNKNAPTYANNEPLDTEIIDILNELITVNRDAHSGYTNAAEHVEDETYRRLFRDYATQRQNFVVELSNLVVREQGEPTETGHLAAVLHRAWANIKAAVTEGDGAILAECDRGEEVALETYQKAMGESMPDHVRDVVRSQMSQVRMAHDRVHSLSAVLD